MSLPISVGDAILLSQIAYNLGQALTSGRKGASAEFAEVQDLLNTLSGALKLLARDLPAEETTKTDQAPKVRQGDLDGEDAALLQMIMNCRGTLKQLENLVAKYKDIDAKSVAQKAEKRWTDEARINWKKILWTKEGAEISKIKVSLTAHINGVNLAVGAINKRQGRTIQDRVHNIDSKLEQIHDWFTQNLQGRELATSSTDHEQAIESPNDRPDLTFSVSIRPDRGSQVPKLWCRHASFREGWWDALTDPTTTQSIFQCYCAEPGRKAAHENPLEVYFRPSSILVRLANLSKPAWHLYAATAIHANFTSSIYVSDVEPSRIAELEARIFRLAFLQAQTYLERGRSNSLISVQPFTAVDGMVSVLDAKTDVKSKISDEEKYCRVTFRVNERHFSARASSAYSILHYRSTLESIDNANMTKNDVHFDSFVIHQPHAEIRFHSSGPHLQPLDDINDQYFIHFYHDTHITYGQTPRTIVLHNVLSISESKSTDGEPANVHQTKCDIVEVEFDEATKTSTLMEDLEAMQRALCVIYLQYPRYGEQIVLQSFTDDIAICDHLVPSSTMTVVLNPEDNQYRIILLSSCHSSSVCMELPPYILESMTTDPLASSHEYPAYFVSVTKEDTFITKQTISLNDMVLHRQGEQLHPILQLRNVDIEASAPEDKMLE